VEAGDYLPHRLVRRLQWGELDEVLEDSGLWSCLGCGTCGLRCPNDIAVDHLVDVLREWSLVEEAAEAANRTKQFHETFLSTIRSYGRIHELTLVARYKLRTRDWLSDMESGFSMFAKGKIPLMPSRVKALREVRRLFSEAEERGAEQGD
jgi:heterodisulfide reductase subunit C